MINENKKEKEGFSGTKALGFSLSQIADQAAYQSFTVLVFTFYFTVVQLPIEFITLAFIIWAFWNSANDPLLGWLSDRTHTKFGRRLPYIMIALVPLGIVMFLLFTPPLSIGIADKMMNFIYFFLIIIIFEFFYTMYSLNATSMFPEIFITQEERTKANNIRQAVLVIGLVVAFILPGFFITAYRPEYLTQFQTFGLVLTFIIIGVGLLFIKFTPKEKREFQKEHENAPSFMDSIKISVRNKSFMWYIPAEICTWFCYTMMATIVPLYGTIVLGVEPLMVSLLLGITFISSTIFITFLWRPIVLKIGPRKTWMISMAVWIGTLIPLMFIEGLIAGIVCFTLIGMGLAGSLYNIDLIVSDIIDEDEVNLGSRREAGYYGVNALFLRLSTVVVFLAIGPLFLIADWQVYDPNVAPTAEQIFTLRALMALLPIIALLIAIFAMYKYPLDGARLKEVKELQKRVHEEKKSNI